MNQFVTPIMQHGMLNDNLHQNVSNHTFHESVLRRVISDSNTGENAVIVEDMRTANMVALVICVLGIPGNVLVIAVYLRRMTTSTRMYMFALAVADLVACIYGIVIATATFSYVGFEIATHCAFVTFTLSVYLLAFVSIERLLAVRHPNTFSLSLLRAKRALAAITVVSLVVSSVDDSAGETKQNAAQRHTGVQRRLVCPGHDRMLFNDGDNSGAERTSCSYECRYRKHCSYSWTIGDVC